MNTNINRNKCKRIPSTLCRPISLAAQLLLRARSSASCRKAISAFFLFSLAVFFILPLLSGCRAADTTPVSKTGFYFDTVIKITLYGDVPDSLFDDCFALCEKEEALISRTLEGSDVYRINHAGAAPVTVSDDTASLISSALSYSRLTNGAFDCSIAPLVSLWDIKNNKGVIPSDQQIASALSLVDYNGIQLDGNTVTLSNAASSIDLGGIAKGYIADKLKELLLSKGVTSALINLGGNVCVIGTKPDGSPFNIGIQKPFAEEGTPITSVKIANQSLVTSGTYERYFEKDGRIYHHILDPSTGWPCDNGLNSVTILSDASVDGDALSTACFVLGLEKGLQLIESLPDVEAMFITTEDELIYSSGFLH